MKDLVLIFAVLILMTFVYQGIKRIDVMKAETQYYSR